MFQYCGQLLKLHIDNCEKILGLDIKHLICAVLI